MTKKPVTHPLVYLLLTSVSIAICHQILEIIKIHLWNLMRAGACSDEDCNCDTAKVFIFRSEDSRALSLILAGHSCAS